MYSESEEGRGERWDADSFQLEACNTRKRVPKIKLKNTIHQSIGQVHAPEVLSGCSSDPFRTVNMGEASWNSVYLEILYQIFGWFAFVVWSISFYPQVLLNYRRKSVVGLNFDFLVLNFTKHSSYLIYNTALFFSPVVQRQYHEKYGFNEMVPVAPNDVAFSIHAVLLTAFTIFQVFIYERGTQKVSKTCIGITVAAWGYATVSLIMAWPNGSWLWLVSCFNLIQVIMTAIKYIPQAWMNFGRKSTEGWSIGNILLDLSGGLANFAQMGMQSIDQNSLENFYGNVGKLLLSLEVVIFDILFILQHYVFYRNIKVEKDEIPSEDALEQLLKKSAKENEQNV